MSDGQFEREGVRFAHRSVGEGVPFVFQHGLGADLGVNFALLAPPPGVRMVGFDARGHGNTRPLGPVDRLSIPQTTDDLAFFLDHLGIERAVVGGISMGAAIALRFGTLHPERTAGLVLSRPAWLDRPHPPNLAPFPLMAALAREFGPEEGKRRFAASDEFLEFTAGFPDAATILLGQFDHPRLTETLDKFERIPASAPWHDRKDWRRITAPTLILANRLDPIHPPEMAGELARLIPGAELVEITSKSVSVSKHEEDVNREVHAFFVRHSERFGAAS